MAEQVYTVTEAAEALKLSTHTVYEAIKQGQLRAARFGKNRGAYRITESAIAEFIAEQSAPTH